MDFAQSPGLNKIPGVAGTTTDIAISGVIGGDDGSGIKKRGKERGRSLEGTCSTTNPLPPGSERAEWAGPGIPDGGGQFPHHGFEILRGLGGGIVPIDIDAVKIELVAEFQAFFDEGAAQGGLGDGIEIAIVQVRPAVHGDADLDIAGMRRFHQLMQF